MKNFVVLLLVLFLALPLYKAIGFTGHGQYCAKRAEGEQCCASRNDNCTAPILVPSGANGLYGWEMIDHLCYCDHFCDRQVRNDGNDCCPDFKEVCGTGLVSYDVGPHYSAGGQSTSDGQLASFAVGEEECSENGMAFGYGQSMKKNCQVCICLGNRWQCDKNVCLIQESLLNQLQQGQFSWTVQNYTKFWGRTLADGIRYRLGTLFPEKSVESMKEIYIKHQQLPLSFDARDKWPQLKEFSHPDQGDCGSSWAFSTTQVAADRLAILSGGVFKEELSVQQLLDCNQHKQKGCQGGFPDRAWWYLRELGVVSKDCYPYTSGESGHPGQCQISKQVLSNPLPIPHCVAGSNNTVYKMSPAYRISNHQEDIQAEILANGPVQATFLVHQDFFMYSGGVYRKLVGSGEHSASGYHSVKILGWGEQVDDNNQSLKYWLCSNSWGTDWGEQGLFRIVKGENHCEIESFVIGAWAKQDYLLQPTVQPLRTKARRRRRRPRKKWRIVPRNSEV